MKQVLVPLALGVLLVSSPLQADCYGALGGAVAGGVGGSVLGDHLGAAAGAALGTALCGGSLALAPFTFGVGPVITCGSLAAVSANVGRAVGGLGGGFLGSEVGGALGRQFDNDDCR